jgi:hypothetical protein
MATNILRNFYYIDTVAIDNYLSSIEGVLYDSGDISEKYVTNKGTSGKVSLQVVQIDAGLKSQIETETHKKVIQTYAAKFQKIYSFLEKDGSIPFYDAIDDETWTNIVRNQMIELDVTLRFSKVDILLSSIDNFFPLLNQIEQNIIDDYSKSVIHLINSFQEINKQNGLPVELRLINSDKYKFVSYLNQDCFVSSFDRIPNEVKIFAKIQRKMKVSEKINLINMIPLLEKIVIDKETRKKMETSIKTLPEELFDYVKGPGALIIPIAMYN